MATLALLSLALLASSSADSAIRRLRRVVAIEDISKMSPEHRNLDAKYYDGEMTPVKSSTSAKTPAESTKTYGMFDVVDDMWSRMMEAMSMSMDMSMPPMPTMAPVPELTSSPTVGLISPGNETSTPTSAPEVNFSSAPTSAPEVNFTLAPTAAPEVNLTSAPTAVPEVNLTSAPTSAPVVTLSSTPSLAPVVATEVPISEIPRCFNSTSDILMAQLLDPPVKDIKICAGTTISIGIPVNAEFSEFAGGDAPLTVLHDDVTIQCGENGDPNDECIISGGYIQFATLVSNPFVPDRNITTNNLLLKGLTFTGQLTDLPGLVSASVAFAAPGSGMVMENCVFDGLTAAIAITNAATLLSGREEYPYFSSDLTVQGCTFNDIAYGASVIVNDGQSMNVVNAVFNDITYMDMGTTPGGLVSSIGGTTSFSDSTFEVFEVATAAAYWVDAPVSGVASSFDFFNIENAGGGVFVNSTTGSDFCAEGLLKIDPVASSSDCLPLF